MTLAIDQTAFLRLPRILELIPVSRSAWWAGVKAGRYPAPVKLGPNTTAWRSQDIRTLLASFSVSGSEVITKERA